MGSVGLFFFYCVKLINQIHFRGIHLNIKWQCLYCAFVGGGGGHVPPAYVYECLWVCDCTSVLLHKRRHQWQVKWNPWFWLALKLCRHGGCRGVAMGGGGPEGHVPPQILGASTKKNHAYIFFNLLIMRVCKYFAPQQNHAYAFLKSALKYLLISLFLCLCKWLFLPTRPPSL